MKPARMLDALHEIPDALQAQPECFHNRFAIAFSAEKSACMGLQLLDRMSDKRFCGLATATDAPDRTTMEGEAEQSALRMPAAAQPAHCQNVRPG